MLPTEMVQLTMDGELCESCIEKEVVRYSVGNQAEHYTKAKLKIDEKYLQTINQEALRDSNNDLMRKRCATRSKFAY